MEKNEGNNVSNVQFSVDDDIKAEIFQQEIDVKKTDNKGEEKKNSKKKGPNMERKKIIRWIIYGVSIVVMLGVMFHSKRLYDLISSYIFLPDKYIQYLAFGLLGINLFFAIFAFLPNVNNLNKILQSILCIVLAYALAMANIMVPNYKGQWERVFVEVPTEGDLMINVYVLNSSEVVDINGLQGKVIGIQSQLDVEYQDYALKVINREFEGNPVESKAYEDIYSIVEALYAGEIDAIMLNESYADIVAGNDDFLTFKEDTRVVYTCVQKISLEYNSENVGDITTEPFIMLIGGSDDRNFNNLFVTTGAGRTDVNMLLVANPITKQVLVVTIPRDSYVALWGDINCMDKLTHATVYSISCWQQTINWLFDVKTNYFFRVNFLSIVKIIDAMGGLKIDNPYEFETHACLNMENYTEGGYAHFPEGEIVLTGAQTVGYVRERYGSKPDGTGIGDFGRNEHQAIVVAALIRQITSVSTITNIGPLLKAIEGTFFTDITIDEIYALAQMQLDDMATWKVIQHKLTGYSAGKPSYAMGKNSGRVYSMVILNEQSLEQAKNLIKKILNSEVIE